jgi:hypothetical protein
MLSVSVGTVRAWVAARKYLDVFRLGRRVLVSVGSIERLLTESFIPAREER